MKRLVIWLTGIMFISFGIAWVLIPKGEGIGIFNGKRFENTVNEEKIEKLDGIGTISVDVSSEDINVIPENREDVRVHLSGGFASSDKDYYIRLDVEKRGSEIRVRVKRPNIIMGFSSSDLKLDIYVPSGYNKSLDIQSSSGDTKVSDLKLEKFNYQASSGELEAKSLQARSADLQVSSGSITLEDFSGKLEASSSSGKMNIDFLSLEDSVDIESSSGDVRLKLPKASNFKLDAATSSGKIECGIALSEMNTGKRSLTGTAGDGRYTVKFRTSSGDVTVEGK